MPERTRVVVVDDHKIMAGSLTGPLASYPDIDVRSIGFDEAFGWTTQWAKVDVAFLDAADPGHGEDRYPGIRLARHARTNGGDDIVIAVITNRYTDDALRARLSRLGREGADFCFDRDALRDPRDLYRFVVDPSTQRAAVPEPTDEWLKARGINRRTDIEAVIDLATQQEILRPESFSSRSTTSRRRIDRVLGQLNGLGFGRPDRRDRNPTVDQVRGFLADVLGRRRG